MTDERAARYAEAYDLRPKTYPDGSWLGQERMERIERFMAMADAEQAELWADYKALAEQVADTRRRADAAEAKVARVEARVAEWEADRDACLSWLVDPAMHVDKNHPTRLSDKADMLNLRAVEIRDALDGERMTSHTEACELTERAARLMRLGLAVDMARNKGCVEVLIRDLDDTAHTLSQPDLAHAVDKGGDELGGSVELGDEPGGDAMHWVPDGVARV